MHSRGSKDLSTAVWGREIDYIYPDGYVPGSEVAASSLNSEIEADVVATTLTSGATAQSLTTLATTSMVKKDEK